MRTDAPDLTATRRAYDAVANDYARLPPDLALEAPLDRAVLAAFTEMLRTNGDPLVADVGCGAGRVTRYLNDAGLRVIGLDLSPNMVGVARATYENLVFAATQAGALPLRTATLGRAPHAASLAEGRCRWAGQTGRQLGSCTCPGRLPAATALWRVHGVGSRPRDRKERRR